MGEDQWFLDLPDKWCRDAAISTGDRVELTLTVAPTDLPNELAQLLSESAAARAAWERLTPSQRRMLREHVLAAAPGGLRGLEGMRSEFDSLDVPDPLTERETTG